MRLKALQFVIVTLLGLVVGPSSSAAYTLLDDEKLRVDVGALTRVGYRAIDDAGIFSHAPYVGMARLAAGATYKPYGRAFVQVDGGSGDVRLLDAIGELRPTEPIAIRFGRFKVPTSRDYLVGAAAAPFVNRSLLVDFVQKRLTGAELVGELSSDALVATAQVGWFQPTPEDRTMLPRGEGNFVSTRAAIDFSFGLGFHVAYLSLVLADNEPVPPVDDPGGPLEAPVTFPELVDFAVTYTTGGWRIFVEGLLAPDAAEDLRPLPWAGYLHALYRFGISDAVALEPGLRYGLRATSGVVTHRATAGLTLHLEGTPLHAMTNYELMAREDLVGHAGYVQIQAGL